MLRQVRLIGGVLSLYLVTVGMVGYTISPFHTFGTSAHRETHNTTPLIHPKKTPSPTIISGKPIRIIITDHTIDLPVDEGVYTEDGSWTLSETHAQFAVMSSLANTHAGNTFIYGHGTETVFGKLASHPPTPDTAVVIQTDNGYSFSYKFQESHNLTPEDTSILDDTASGAPRLTIQTCTGAWDEWRTMFVFTFEKVSKT